jgi:hypothetical protein
MGMALSTELRRTIRPPRPTYLFAHNPSLFRSETRRGSQVEARRGFAPTGRPRYLKGRELVLQLRKTDATLKKSGETLTPTKLLFQKFIFSPEHISNPLKIALRDHKI